MAEKTPKETKTSNRLLLTQEERARRDLIFRNNPVLIGGLALAPVVMAATTLRNAVILSIAVMLIEIPVRILGNLTVGFIPQRLRPMFYAFFAAAFYIPALMVLRQMFDIYVFLYVGIYLPLLVCDALILGRSEIASRERFSETVLNGLGTAVGFSIAICLVGLIREILCTGTVWGTPLPFVILRPLPIAGVAAGGFILTALLAAACQWTVGAVKRGLFRRSD